MWHPNVLLYLVLGAGSGCKRSGENGGILTMQMQPAVNTALVAAALFDVFRADAALAHRNNFSSDKVPPTELGGRRCVHTR